MKTNIIAILGAPDPEMSFIEKLLRAAGIPICYATDSAGRRVTPSGAYRPVGIQCGEGFTGPRPGQVKTLLRVECGEGAVTALRETILQGSNPDVVVIDHHNPGDPGFGRPATEAVEASSLGQVVAWLTEAGLAWEDWDEAQQVPLLVMRGQPGLHVFPVDGPEGWRTAAANDHAAAGALLGKVPDVKPADVRGLRARNLCGFHKLTAEEFAEAVEATVDVLEGCPSVGNFRDTRQAPMRLLPLDGRLIPEAALQEGLAYLSEMTERPLGPDRKPDLTATPVRKVVVGGHCTDDDLRFFEAWAADQGLVRPYVLWGRGMGGAYYA